MLKVLVAVVVPMAEAPNVKSKLLHASAASKYTRINKKIIHYPVAVVVCFLLCWPVKVPQTIGRLAWLVMVKVSVRHCVADETARPLPGLGVRTPFSSSPTDVESVLGPEMTKVLKSSLI